MRPNFAEHRIQETPATSSSSPPAPARHRQTMATDGERTADTSRVQHPDEVQWRFAVIPLLLSVVLVASVLAYRCRAHRLRRERLAREQHEELREFTAAQDTEAGGMPSSDPYRSAAAVGLGGNYYMSAYKKLLQQA